jgi:hypothetical protein
MCCPSFASSTSFNLAGCCSLPTFENVLTFQREFKSTYCIAIFSQFIDFRPQYLFSNFVEYLAPMPTWLRHRPELRRND